ncbi:MAG: hypothetical protein ACOCTU_05365, partial [Bacteroidota bacterium]
MKRYNEKQKAYSKSKIGFSIRRLQGLFLLLVLAFMTLPVVATAIQNPDVSLIDTLGAILMGSGSLKLGFAMSNIGDIQEISDKYSSPRQIGMRIYLVAVEQIDTDEAFPTPNAEREISTIPLKSGEYMKYFEAVDGTPNENASGEKGDIVTTTTRNFEFTIAGNRDKSLDFLEEYSGKGFVLIYSIGEDETKYLLGSRFKPMVLSNFDRQGGGPDGRYVTLTFSSEYWRQPLKYVGSIIRQSPETVDADATTIPITSNDRYRLSDGSTDTVTINDVSGVGEADHGRVVNILAPESAD